jgi:hypothetical protein
MPYSLRHDRHLAEGGNLISNIRATLWVKLIWGGASVIGANVNVSLALVKKR